MCCICRKGLVVLNGLLLLFEPMLGAGEEESGGKESKCNRSTSGGLDEGKFSSFASWATLAPSVVAVVVADDMESLRDVRRRREMKKLSFESLFC